MSKTHQRPKHPTHDLEQRVAKAFSHPLRVRILAALDEQVASPNMLSKELGERLNLIAYHVRVLDAYGCIELVETQPRRGATEHFYRATRNRLLSPGEWERFATLEGRHLSRRTLRVDDSGWREIAELLDATHERLTRIESDAVKRLGADPGTRARVEMLQARASDKGD